MRLIDADALTNDILRRWNTNDDTDFANKEVWKALEEAPTIDAVPVVRCKDCKQCDSEYQNLLKEKLDLYGLCENTETMVYSDDFCSYGERKDDE